MKNKKRNRKLGLNGVYLYLENYERGAHVIWACVRRR
jgi:hypothetical protein